MKTDSLTRRRLQVRGVVQGVGFRPFVHRLAREMALTGWVRNGVTGVHIEIQGDADKLSRFAEKLIIAAPRLARIDEIITEDIALEKTASSFFVEESACDGAVTTIIGADSAICDLCLKEMLTPSDRRYRYPFINCTHCGPRYTLVRHLPYDRATTSMSVFTQCAECLTEYTNTEHRRYHAEPNACPRCGPHLKLYDAKGQSLMGDAIHETLRVVRDGAIVAVKGLGGFHLACDARNRSAVDTLRRRKMRDEKPFALMMLNIESARCWCEIDEEEAKLLQSSERPIVLLKKKIGVDDIFPKIAGGMNTLGIMLPYTPIHYLLFHEALGRPSTHDWLQQAHDSSLVMTSANPCGEPLVIDNEEALRRLSGIADYWLMHDRQIVSRCDDSVVRANKETGGPLSTTPQFIRRARGYTPRAIRLRCTGNVPPVLATGGFFKNTVCITRDDEAFLSPHIGSLDNVATRLAFDATVTHLLKLLDVTPQAIAHDRHPDFYSTHVAAALAQRFSVPLIGVSHHHAHIAATVAEHHIDEPVVGLAFDGMGLGDDDTTWGGELLLVDDARCIRIGHLMPLLLVGGDRAAREPWRMAASVLAQTMTAQEAERTIARRFGAQSAVSTVTTLLLRAQNQKSLHTPLTTSMGRAFDAAAGALSVCACMSYEGQAAMLLEGLAHRYLDRHSTLPADTSLYRIDESMLSILDIKPLLASLFDIDDAEYGAALFHGTLIAATVDWTDRNARRENIRQIVCGGGCFMNTLLARGVERGLSARGYRVWQSRAVPSNDGGLSLGQAWVAIQMLIGNQ
ncbi:MAG: carbamoyltransferase HypF [Burkholderiales bacterium]|jgi:hydrogenase maturation protein HypF|nr:carbamoyltransferase HypF [Burkholderiales bacterium]